MEIWFPSPSVNLDLLSDITTFWSSFQVSTYLISKYRYAASGGMAGSRILGHISWIYGWCGLVISQKHLWEKYRSTKNSQIPFTLFGIILFCTSFWYFSLLFWTNSPYDWIPNYFANRLFFPHRKRTSHPLSFFVIIRGFFFFLWQEPLLRK